jgi:hypothetical protein
LTNRGRRGNLGTCARPLQRYFCWPRDFCHNYSQAANFSSLNHWVNIRNVKLLLQRIFRPLFISLIQSAFLPDLFTTNRIEISQFKLLIGHVDAMWRHKMNTISSWRTKIVVNQQTRRRRPCFWQFKLRLLYEFWIPIHLFPNKETDLQSERKSVNFIGMNIDRGFHASENL